MQHLILLIVDECSLMDAQPLGNMHGNACQTVHGGRNIDKPWGGTPVVIFFEDHYQLPSVAPGVFESMDEKTSQQVLSRKLTDTQKQFITDGWKIFQDMTAHVHTLRTSHRVSPEQSDFRQLLTNLRAEENQDITDGETKHLLSLRMNRSQNCSAQEIEQTQN